MANGYVNNPSHQNHRNPYAYNQRNPNRPMPGRMGFFPPAPLPPEERGQPMFCLFPDKQPKMSRAGRQPSPEQIFGLQSSGPGAGQPMSRPEDAPDIVERAILRAFELSRSFDEVVLRALSNLRGSVSSALSSLSSPANSSLLSRDDNGNVPWLQLLTETWELHSWSIIIGLAVTVVASLAAWFFAPKGENRTYVSIPNAFGRDCR